MTKLIDLGRPVLPGDVLGVVETKRGPIDILAPGAGIVRGSMVRKAQQVAAGEGVLWLARA